MIVHIVPGSVLAAKLSVSPSHHRGPNDNVALFLFPSNPNLAFLEIIQTDLLHAGPGAGAQVANLEYELVETHREVG